MTGYGKPGLSQSLRRWIGKNPADGNANIAIFEIGTNATRILLAPKTVPQRWGQNTFWSDNQRHQVGLSVDGEGYLNPKAEAFIQMTRFIAERNAWLTFLGIEDIKLFATAWFRSLSNKEEIAQRFEVQTGLKIRELPQADEATLTIKSMPVIHERLANKIEIRQGTQVVLIDHGGGSLETSWMVWPKDHAVSEVGTHCIERFGTVRLKRQYFSGFADDGDNPQSIDQTPVHKRIAAVRSKTAKEMISFHTAANEILEHGRETIVFCTGTAVRKLLGDIMSPTRLHGRKVTRKDIEYSLVELLSKYSDDDPNSEQMSDAPPRKTDINRISDHRDLDLICGLPVYLEILSALEADEIRVLGYPLRYGYYLDCCFGSLELGDNCFEETLALQ